MPKLDLDSIWLIQDLLVYVHIVQVQNKESLFGYPECFGCPYSVPRFGRLLDRFRYFLDENKLSEIKTTLSKTYATNMIVVFFVENFRAQKARV